MALAKRNHWWKTDIYLIFKNDKEIVYKWKWMIVDETKNKVCMYFRNDLNRRFSIAECVWKCPSLDKQAENNGLTLAYSLLYDKELRT